MQSLIQKFNTSKLRLLASVTCCLLAVAPASAFAQAPNRPGTGTNPANQGGGHTLPTNKVTPDNNNSVAPYMWAGLGIVMSVAGIACLYFAMLALPKVIQAIGDERKSVATPATQALAGAGIGALLLTGGIAVVLNNVLGDLGI
jgi:hypothetical protein